MRLEAGGVHLRTFAGVLGRLCFACGPLPEVGPFVSPLFAWSAARGYRGTARLPWSVRLLLQHLHACFADGRRTREIMPPVPHLGEAFRGDAKAAGMEVIVGAWECWGGVPPAQARWFSVALTKTTAPWAFHRGEPFRTIASLELFTSLLGRPGSSQPGCQVDGGRRVRLRRTVLESGWQ